MIPMGQKLDEELHNSPLRTLAVTLRWLPSRFMVSENLPQQCEAECTRCRRRDLARVGSVAELHQDQVIEAVRALFGQCDLAVIRNDPVSRNTGRR